MIQPATFTFLKNLKKNNNREWFDAHKEQYLAAKDNVSDFLNATLPEFVKLDKGLAGLTAKDCLFRIYRDVRFSKDKKPYKTNMGAGITPGGKKAIAPGYYIHLEPGQSFIAGGMWMPPADQLKMIRQEIDYNGPVLKKVLTNKTFKSYYGTLDTDHKLKTCPKGYAKDHPDIELLKLNSFIVLHSFDDKTVLGKNFSKEIAKGAKIMKPLLDFLATAIS